MVGTCNPLSTGTVRTRFPVAHGWWRRCRHVCTNTVIYQACKTKNKRSHTLTLFFAHVGCATALPRLVRRPSRRAAAGNRHTAHRSFHPARAGPNLSGVPSALVRAAQCTRPAHSGLGFGHVGALILHSRISALDLQKIHRTKHLV